MDIEAYLDGSMSAGERAAFEKRILADPTLREALEQHQALKTDLDWYFASKDVENANLLRAQIKAKRLWWTRLLLAALLVLLVGVVAFWFLRQERELPQPTLETPELQKNTSPIIEAPVQSVPTPPVQKSEPQNQPIAGDLRPRKGDLMRNLPAEEISAPTLSFFKQQWAGFVPAVPAVGVWAKPLKLIRNNQAAEARALLNKTPQGDTSTYLLAISELMLKRPSDAQELLYPLTSDKKWQIEAQYLLVWAYLLEGNMDLTRASLQVLPAGFRDKDEINAFLIKE